MWISPVSRSTILVEAPMKTPMESTEPSSTTTPSTTSERAPMKQLSSMITGPACNGSSTPPMPAPPERCTFLPICAQEPTVAQVSTIVPESTNAPMLKHDGISTTFGAMYAPRRTVAGGTTLAPPARKSSALTSAYSRYEASSRLLVERRLQQYVSTRTCMSPEKTGAKLPQSSRRGKECKPM